jgi:hypothetical protein
MVGTAGVTILNADGTAHTARATAGISELVAGTGVLYVAHPAIGTPLIFVWDKGVGTLGASETTTGVYDTLGFIEYTEPGEGVTLAEAVLDVKEKTDNLPASPAAVGSAMTLTAAYDAAKDDVLTPLAVVDGNVDTLLSRITTAITPTNIAEAVRDIATSGLAALKVLIDAVKAKTDTIPASPAAVGSAMTLAADAVSAAALKADAVAEIQAGLALDATITEILEDTATTIPATLASIGANAATAAGADFGEDECTLTITDTTSAALSDAQVYITDSGGHRSRTKTTDSLGQVKFDLTSGQSYNLWVTHDRYTGAVPVVFVASEDV